MRSTGLGDRMICLGAAWLFARNTGRTLVADWRFSQYSPNKWKNLFPYCFQTPAELAGVPFTGDDTIEKLLFPSPREPEVWNDDRLLKLAFMRPKKNFLEDRDRAVALIRTGGDVPAPTVVFDACVNDGLVLTRDSRTFFNGLLPLRRLRAEADSFHREHLGGGPLIGLHVRHGNGGKTGHDHYWLSVRDALDRCAAAVKLAREQLEEPARVFLCTDNAELERAVCEKIPQVVCRPKSYRPVGAGEQHLWDGASQTRDDAVVEMLLLAQCDALIRFPPHSFFSFYPAVMKPWRGTIPETVYDLQKHCIPGDDLSPALLL
jgi:hypothetical protein